MPLIGPFKVRRQIVAAISHFSDFRGMPFFGFTIGDSMIAEDQ